jgi:hypothetical protein
MGWPKGRPRKPKIVTTGTGEQQMSDSMALPSVANNEEAERLNAIKNHDKIARIYGHKSYTEWMEVRKNPEAA